jgi:TetR/AcrR family transcriptional repressor of mexJK operon
MDDIARAAGLTKRTLYNNYADKNELFRLIVGDVIDYAEAFARGLHQSFVEIASAAALRDELTALAERMALAIARPEVIALRRLLVGESRVFPNLATEYFDRAPGQVIDALGREFAQLAQRGLLRLAQDGGDGAANARLAAAQFAYLIVGAPLDRAMLVGKLPPAKEIRACAREGVETFLARYAPARGRSRPQ